MKFLDKLFANRNSIDKRIQEASDNAQSVLPGYLLYPSDPISRDMFESQMKTVRDKRCGYQFKLYTAIANVNPDIKKQMPAFDIHETHIFWKPDSPAWCSVSTMKALSVKTSNLRNWVEANDQMGLMFGDILPFLNLPTQMNSAEYKRVKMHYLGENKTYNELHDFEETHTYCHVFYLDGKLYKKFILCARKESISWKAECTIPSDTENLMPADMVPPGQMFGSFFPL